MTRGFLIALLALAVAVQAGCVGGVAADASSAGNAPRIDGSGEGGEPGAAPVRLDGSSQAVRYAGREVTVSAAASLRAAFTDLADRFEERTGATVVLNFAASGVLQRQIEGGAPADVFASAARRQVRALLDQGLLDPSSVRTFAGNSVVLVAPVGSAHPRSVADLAGPDIRRVVTGNPETAPHGESSLEVLGSMGLLEDVRPKLIFAANVAQTLDYVARGEVDAGLLFLTEALRNDRVRLVETMPPDSHQPIRYVLGVTRDTAQPEAAASFAGFVLSEQGQSVLQSYGFERAP